MTFEEIILVFIFGLFNKYNYKQAEFWVTIFIFAVVMFVL